MIPYDDLVVALQTWRARQGLPVGQLSGSLTPPSRDATPAAVAAPATTPGSGPRTAPPAPAAPAARFVANVATPPPLAPADTADSPLDVDDSALLEEQHYEPEGDDFAMAFSALTAQPEQDSEATEFGNPPGGGMQPEPPGAPGTKRRRDEDW